MSTTALTHMPQHGDQLAITEPQLIEVLRASLYPDAAPESVALVLGYCRAANLDPMQKPVHIVPMWSKAAGSMRDVIMPGIALYRIQASRSGQLAGIGQPEFGPDKTENIGGITVTYPEWCRVVVRRRMPTGEIAEFIGLERWRENYAQKGGKERSIAPNSMWERRPSAQLAKCAESQALRRAFPEMCSAPTAEEMEGRQYQERDATPTKRQPVPDPFQAAALPALPAPTWQSLYPHAWGDEPVPGRDGKTYGEIADADDGETAMRDLWRNDPSNPWLCAWSAQWIEKAAAQVRDFDLASFKAQLGVPDIFDCTPKQLRTMAGTLLKWLAQQADNDAKEAQEAQ